MTITLAPIDEAARTGAFHLLVAGNGEDARQYSGRWCAEAGAFVFASGARIEARITRYATRKIV